MAEDIKNEKPEGITVEYWADFGATVSKLMSGNQPDFAFLMASRPGRTVSITWSETAANVLALAAALEYAADKLRQHGANMGPDTTGKPN